ncbi:hypothetical protein E3N88_45928 [Mikania micrantha]|uniref:DUF659 domain-containing protein n=1 Tax=Mikania micrantha TaxID=192012 RepID=A0A5N6LA35_9ASTR|nr:hypothetical protein E3N88_45928 [Mikania micrantha]
MAATNRNSIIAAQLSTISVQLEAILTSLKEDITAIKTQMIGKGGNDCYGEKANENPKNTAAEDSLMAGKRDELLKDCHQILEFKSDKQIHNKGNMTGEKLFELLDKFVEQIGEANVVQIITDNGSNFKLAGQLLMQKRKHLFWTPCAAHCIDLMLEDVGKISKVKTTIQKGIFFVGYIYNHSGVLNMMREFTSNKELTRAGVTRFATMYLTLQSLQKQKSSLRNMFASEKWTSSKWSKEAKGKRACEIIFTPTFWNNVLFTLKVMGPLVRVLRLVDNEKRPAMGYVYEAMERAKIAIGVALGKDSTDYLMVSTIIDKRWNCQLHHPLHAAGYYLNPEFYCYNVDIESDKEVYEGLIECIKRLVPDKSKQDLIMTEMVIWVNQEGFFCLEFAKRAHGKIAPAEWWKLYGKGTPNLQQFAIKVLSLTYDCNEWLIGTMEEDLVFEGEDLTWDAVGSASDQEEDDEASDAKGDESDLDLAWKLLVDEKSIVEKQPGDTMKKVYILSALTKVALEREDVENSLNDYLKALWMLERLAEPDSIHIAELNFGICLCLELGSKGSNFLHVLNALMVKSRGGLEMYKDGDIFWNKDVKADLKRRDLNFVNLRTSRFYGLDVLIRT